jgi:CDP-diacylglycerol--serine O-phosphatidyltransferase
LPNSFRISIAISITFLNLLAGCLSLVATINENYAAAALLILIAVVMDSLDGRVARHLDSTTSIGKELDSLCDLVSFGVAPALLIYSQLLADKWFVAGLIVVLVYVACGAFRLARFNVSGAPDYFMGVPITFAGLFLAIVSLLSAYLPVWMIVLLVLLLSYLMISSIRVPKPGAVPQ